MPQAPTTSAAQLPPLEAPPLDLPPLPTTPSSAPTPQPTTFTLDTEPVTATTPALGNSVDDAALQEIQKELDALKNSATQDATQQ